MRHTLTALGFAAILCGVLTGCTTSGVGDPCDPESVPEDGFGRDEVFLETNSVQCRTRVCLVYKLRGNPRHVIGEDSCPCVDGTLPEFTEAGLPSCALRFDDCVAPAEITERIHCSCRCALLEGASSSLPLCDCPNDYVCEGERALGGDGIAGRYCIRESVANR
jgi:hypothetical protein